MTSVARLRRAAVAERLWSSAPQAAQSLDWDALDHAPGWLALADADLAVFQCRVGAVLCGRALRLWIDRGRLAAARAALGAPFLSALLVEPDSASIPNRLFACPEIDSPADVEPALSVAGASVLLAALADGPLRDAVQVLLAPALAATMASESALALIAHAESLASCATGQPRTSEAALEGAAA